MNRCTDSKTRTITYVSSAATLKQDFFSLVINKYCKYESKKKTFITIEIILYLLDLFDLTHGLGEIDFCKTFQSSNGLSELQIYIHTLTIK